MPGMMFGLVVLPVTFFVFLIIWAAVGAYFRIRLFWLFMIASMPGFVVFMFLLILGVKFWNSQPSIVWSQCFQSAVPADVVIAKSSWDGYFDCDTRHLKFYANQSTIDEIAHREQLASDADISMYTTDQPGWWCPRISPNCQIYMSHTHGAEKHGFYSELEILTYNPSTKEAYYMYRGID